MRTTYQPKIVAGLVEIVVAEQELSGVGALFCPVVDPDEVELPALVSSSVGPKRGLERDLVPDFPSEPLGRDPARDRPRPQPQPALPLLVRDLKLGVDGEVLFRVHHDLGEEVPGLLVDASEPRERRGVFDTRHLFDIGLVAAGKELDDRDLVAHHQAVGSGYVDPRGERHPYRPKKPEENEGDEDRGHGQRRPDAPSLQIGPDERPVPHAIGSSLSRPLSR
jgi:hypothetical protein